MRFEPSEWRASDAAAYESARDALNFLTSLLLAYTDSSPRPENLTEIASFRREFHDLDGFDRVAIEMFRDRVASRTADFHGERL